MSFNTPPRAPATTTLRVKNEHVTGLRGRAAPTVTDYVTWKFNVLLFNADSKKKKKRKSHPFQNSPPLCGFKRKCGNMRSDLKVRVVFAISILILYFGIRLGEEKHKISEPAKKNY